MKVVLTGLAVVAPITCSFIFGQGCRPSDTESDSVSGKEALIKLEQEWNDALVKADVVVLDSLIADDYMDTDPGGAVESKKESLADLRSGDLEYTSAVNDEFTVHIYGNAAVLNYRSTVKGKFKGMEISGVYRVTDTWVKRAGRWQCVAAHLSKMASGGKSIFPAKTNTSYKQVSPIRRVAVGAGGNPGLYRDLCTQSELFSTAALSGTLFAKDDRYRLFAKLIYPAVVATRPDFEKCYCVEDGRPAVEPVLLLRASILQELDGMPDRQAIEILRYHAGWNFALNRQIGDGVFHPTTLVNFRNRLQEHEQSAVKGSVL